MDEKQFYCACEKIINEERERQGIGTLQEKTIHAVLKHYCEPNVDLHEIRQNGFVADIVQSDQILEIQTRGFDRLRKKLEAFLKVKPVTIVYPIPYVKWISWIDCETAEISKRRKSPKKGSIYDIVPELYKIKMFLPNENLSFRLILINMEETRLLNGWSYDKKRGSHRHDRIPLEIVDEVYFTNSNEFSRFIPDQLNDPFTTDDFHKAAKISIDRARTTVHILAYLNIIKKVGNQGKFIVYERNDKDE